MCPSPAAKAELVTPAASTPHTAPATNTVLTASARDFQEGHSQKAWQFEGPLTASMIASRSQQERRALDGTHTKIVQL
jgi:hypothetical protein